GKDGVVTKHAVGSRAKRAKAKVQYGLACRKSYDRSTMGEVKVELTKNTTGAHIEKVRMFRVGGDGEGVFTWERMETVAPGDSEWLAMRNAIRDLLRDDQPEKLSQNQVCARISGSNAKIKNALAEM